MEKQLNTELEEKKLVEVIAEEEISTMVNPGDEVPDGFTYPNNAVIQNNTLNLKDENGTDIANRYVSIGDEITVLKIDADKQLVLIQYPSGSIVREGYVTNDTSSIKYLNEYDWSNGSTNEPVYETESSDNGEWGTLSPYEKATKLYKKENRTCVAYDTSKGPFTKSGFVDYEGGASSGGSSDSTNGIKPGEIVPDGFTYPNNAVIQNDSLYLRDENGNQIAGRSVSVGDEITVLDVGYTKQLALIQYPTSSGVVQGYVTNSTNIISYKNPYNWVNGSTPESVYPSATSTDSSYGTLSAREAATLLYKEGNRYHVVYDTGKGPLTKSGYVNYEGTGETGGSGVDTDITIPVISHSEIEIQQYGKSGKGRPLNVYKIGNGSKVIFAGFAIHGWEDNWNNDGLALVKLANALALKIADYKAKNGNLHGWKVYIAPCMNPDGVIIGGRTATIGENSGAGNNGIGRCAVTTRIDMNRCFPYNFKPYYTSRNYTGSTSLGAPEAADLKNFIEKIRPASEWMYVLDFHGWMTSTQGSPYLAKYFTKQFGFKHYSNYASGFFSSWAASFPNSDGLLIEYPENTHSYNDIINGDYIGKTYNAILNLIKDNASSNNDSNDSNDSNNEETYNHVGTVSATVLNVRSGPGILYNIEGQLNKGDSITITSRIKPNGESLYWYKIDFQSKKGYVRSDYLIVLENYITRDQWGASSMKLENGTPEYINTKNYNTIAIHHTSRSCNEKIKDLQDYFQNKRGYIDIGYHYVIAGNGNIYEGRPINVKGGTIQGNNTGKIGIALMGNFHNNSGVIGDITDFLKYIIGAEMMAPTTEQADSLKQLIKILKLKYNIVRIGGHKDLALPEYPTECPGNIAYPLLKKSGIIQL